MEIIIYNLYGQLIIKKITFQYENNLAKKKKNVFPPTTDQRMDRVVDDSTKAWHNLESFGKKGVEALQVIKILVGLAQVVLLLNACQTRLVEGGRERRVLYCKTNNNNNKEGGGGWFRKIEGLHCPGTHQ